MGIDTRIIDPETGRSARVGAGGAVATGPARPSTSFNGTLGVNDAVVNIVPARSNRIFCVTAIILTGNKAIDPNTDAVVNIYTAVNETSATAVSTLITLPVARSSQTILTAILVESGEGEYINGKTSDDDVFVTILGFYL